MRNLELRAKHRKLSNSIKIHTMKRLLTSIILLILISCAKQTPEDMIAQLDGYWMIEKVEMPDGVEKDFRLSTTIDFIEINGDFGVRKKVQPQLDGSFLTNDSAETFELKIENDSLNLYYQTPFDSWKESVLKTGDSLLKILNKEGKLYTYRRFRKFNIPE